MKNMGEELPIDFWPLYFRAFHCVFPRDLCETKHPDVMHLRDIEKKNGTTNRNHHKSKITSLCKTFLIAYTKGKRERER